MTPSTLPNKLWRAASQVKSFVEKMPNGVSLSVIRDKVSAYSSLINHDRKKLVEHLKQRENILVFEVKPPAGGRKATFLRHKKFGWPKDMPCNLAPEIKSCSKCHLEKPTGEFYKNSTTSDGKQSYCIECVKASSAERSWKKGDSYAKRPATTINEINEMEIKPAITVSPTALRQQAEELIRKAEEAENAAKNNDLFNKKLQPIRLEILQAIAGAQKLFDQQMDAMASLEVAAAKLRNLTA
ncbi:hypothetical protein [Serratia sp. M24T3]|uniref:hypothetical protein n=1 Tax=Serratia sp. M24T3 TaxID=932213 RepID=UPI00025B9161|nr:hypothetical protein [Serratia sp. M24T3]EIC84033.1 hypothetical protein SPM24T3_13990 [Serratia sp. M24T3]